MNNSTLVSKMVKHILHTGSRKIVENDDNESYYYVIDLHERGYFSAHVEDTSGKIVFEFSNDDSEDGSLSMVEDGFMRNIDDVDGLEEYLKYMGVIPSHAYVYDDRKRTWRGNRLGESVESTGGFDVTLDFSTAQYENLPDSLTYNIKDLVIETPEGNITVPDAGALSLDFGEAEFLQKVAKTTNGDITQIANITLQNPPQKFRYNGGNDVTTDYTVTVVYDDSNGDRRQLDVQLNNSIFTPSHEFTQSLNTK